MHQVLFESAVLVPAFTGAPAVEQVEQSGECRVKSSVVMTQEGAGHSPAGSGNGWERRAAAQASRPEGSKPHGSRLM
ncbi:MAG: hypothetical protein SGPRY_000963 [Prymnesium sp.]